MTTPAQPLDLSGPIRTAILGSTDIVMLLGDYEGAPAVFTSRPVPSQATYPMAVVSPVISVGNMDFLRARLPLPRYDVAFYGQQPGDYRTVEALAFMARQLFHRQRFAVDLTPNFSVLELVADGPIAAPTDDQSLVGRAVLLRFKLEETAGA